MSLHGGNEDSQLPEEQISKISRISKRRLSKQESNKTQEIMIPSLQSAIVVLCYGVGLCCGGTLCFLEHLNI